MGSLARFARTWGSEAKACPDGTGSWAAVVQLPTHAVLSPLEIRSRSRFHADHPYVFSAGGNEYRVAYVPGDSDGGMFGGNPNWRGPIWMPMQLMLVRALVNQYPHLGNNFKVECSIGSGRQLDLLEVSHELARRRVPPAAFTDPCSVKGADPGLPRQSSHEIPC